MRPVPEPIAIIPTGTNRMPNMKIAAARAGLDQVDGDRVRRVGLGVAVRAGFVACSLVVMMVLRVVEPHGGSAAAAEKVKGTTTKTVDPSGRWSGRLGGFSTSKACGEKPCSITLDIQPCDGHWCGVRVSEQNRCAGQALTLEIAEKRGSATTFNGKLEIAAGSAPFVVEATYWLGPDDGKPRLSFIGDTGPELMFMRRSFPLQAQLGRTGDAVCSVPRAAS